MKHFKVHAIIVIVVLFGAAACNMPGGPAPIITQQTPDMTITALNELITQTSLGAALPTKTASVTPPPIQEVELAENTELSEASKYGEINVKFSPWMRPRTSEDVLVSIFIPQKLQKVEKLKVSTKNISPDVAKIIGSDETDSATILINRQMCLFLSSPTFKIIPYTTSSTEPTENVPICHEVSYEPNSPTQWLWSITATEVEGNHHIVLQVYLDEVSTDPSWVRSYQIEVIQPTSTPAPTNTPTPIPPPTFTPTPTLTFFRREQEQFINDPAKYFQKLSPIGAALAWLTGIMIGILRRRDEIQRIETELSGKLPKIEKERLQKELSRLKEIKWWQFWKWK